MINKNQNVNLNRSLDRIVDIGNNWLQITINDQRYYSRDKEFYPSVSYILSYYPKGKHFENWIKSKGDEADEIAQEAAMRGTAVHGAIEKMLKGYQPKWIEENGYINYSLDEWKMILRFAEFWNEYKPKLIKSEIHIFSDAHKFAGTIDLVIEINKELWVIDLKTSNSLHTIYELQLAAYAYAWNEQFPDQKVQKTGILWLKSPTRKSAKGEGKMQGKGWALKTFDRTYDESFGIFRSVYSIFKVENPILKPATEFYANDAKLILD